MVAGRGFTAYTAVVFGGSNPIGVALVTLLFGFADAIGIRVELLGTGIPSSIISMLPYVLASWSSRSAPSPPSSGRTAGSICAPSRLGATIYHKGRILCPGLL